MSFVQLSGFVGFRSFYRFFERVFLTLGKEMVEIEWDLTPALLCEFVLFGAFLGNQTESYCLLGAAVTKGPYFGNIYLSCH